MVGAAYLHGSCRDFSVNALAINLFLGLRNHANFTGCWQTDIMNAPEINRAADRKPLDILVEGRMRSRPVCVELIDVSEGGCKIKGKFGFTQEGETISLKVDGIRAPLGKVVWVEDTYAGVAFDGKMHQAIIDHLCRKRLEKRLDKAPPRAA